MFELLLITGGSAPDRIADQVRAALAGAPAGRVAVQLRAKELHADARLVLAQELRELTQRAGAPLLINGDLSVAARVGADGVQLPEAGPPPTAARARLGPRALIGASCHDYAGLVRAAVGGASFATLSPVFASPGKGSPLGIAAFQALVAGARLPIFALGGVAAEQAAACRHAGATGLAVISSVFAHPQPGAAVTSLLAAWDAAAR